MISIFFLLNENKKIYLVTSINKLDENIINNYDFIFIIPDFINSIPNHFVNFVINTDSLIEMPNNCIITYLKLINKIIKFDGYFYENNAICNNINFVRENEKIFK
jgi:hypothetical protein